MNCEFSDSYRASAGADSWLAPDPVRDASERSATQVCGPALIRLLGIDPGTGGSLDRASFVTRQVHEGQALTHAGDTCRTLYVVKSGSFKVCMLDPSGSVQGLGFPMAGDTIGADGLASGYYGSEAIALEASDVVMISVEQMMQLSRDDPSAATLFHRMIGREIVRDQSVLYLLGSLSAEARVATFLLDLSDRHRRQGRSGQSFALQMKRRDIANYVGLKIETVCRVLTAFTCDGILRIEKRRIEIVAARRLRRIASGATQATRPRRARDLTATTKSYAVAI